MKKNHKSTLQFFHVKLMRDLRVNEMFLAPFLQKGVLHEGDIEEILSGPTSNAKTARFLSILPKCGPQAYDDCIRQLKDVYPWIAEEMEAYFNKLAPVIDYNNPVFGFLDNKDCKNDPLSTSDTSNTIISNGEKNTKTNSSFHEEESSMVREQKLIVARVYKRLAVYLDSRGVKEYDLALSEVPEDILEMVVSEIIEIISNQDTTLLAISSLFTQEEKEANSLYEIIQGMKSNIESMERTLEGMIEMERKLKWLEEDQQEKNKYIKLLENTQTALKIKLDEIEKQRKQESLMERRFDNERNSQHLHLQGHGCNDDTPRFMKGSETARTNELDAHGQTHHFHTDPSTGRCEVHITLTNIHKTTGKIKKSPRPVDRLSQRPSGQNTSRCHFLTPSNHQEKLSIGNRSTAMPLMTAALVRPQSTNVSLTSVSRPGTTISREVTGDSLRGVYRDSRSVSASQQSSSSLRSKDISSNIDGFQQRPSCYHKHHKTKSTRSIQQLKGRGYHMLFF
ncbi:uncharacterized protein [Haliotis cracherodii]|uniref:uncharacterized protein n=1 Tax=Haliotis cracherodii TaxID=6455 RepID=UPI0039ED0A8C